MRGKLIVCGILFLVLFSVFVIPGLAQAPDPQSGTEPETAYAPFNTAFTYQGKLLKDGEPVSEICDLSFRLYDAATGGLQMGRTVTATVPISDGFFIAPLDFGSSVFTGPARWLEIASKCRRDLDYTTFARQALTAAPYAHYALAAGSATTANVALTATAAISAATAFSASWATTATVAGEADLLDGQHGYFYQTAISEGCAEGSSIRVVYWNGTVICHLDVVFDRSRKPGAPTIRAVPSTGDEGLHTSMTIGFDGFPLISYYDATNGDLKVAHCSDVDCNSMPLTDTVDSSGDVGQDTSIIIGADGYGLISYYDVTNGNLKVAHCSNLECSYVYIYIPDSVGDVGRYTSVTIGGDGLPLISYYDVTNGDLKVMHCAISSCSSVQTYTLDSTGNVGQYTSIATGVDGYGLISYYDVTNGNLKVAHCNNYNCSTAAIYTLDSVGDVGRYTSVTIGNDGFGLITYYDVTNGDLKATYCSYVVCNVGASFTLYSAGDVGQHSSVTIGADGLPLISYYDITNSALRAFHCSDVNCMVGSNSSIINVGDVGFYTSLTIGVNGLPMISYYDMTNGNLSIARCFNTFCAPYFRRR